MGFDEADLTHDAFLGGQIMAWQPKRGYRAATDPVLLAAACEARTGQSVLELGCGVGVASLCLAARVPGLAITGVEKQAAYADLARRNAGKKVQVITADLADLPVKLRQKSFDHVIMNPPYFRPGAGNPAQDQGREQAFREETPLATWIDITSRRLAPKGWLTVIHLAERLPELMSQLHGRLGSISLRPLVAREGRAAGRILLRARKEGRAPFEMLSPLVLHQGTSHMADAENFTPQTRAILREGAALPWA